MGSEERRRKQYIPEKVGGFGIQRMGRGFNRREEEEDFHRNQVEGGWGMSGGSQAAGFG